MNSFYLYSFTYSQKEKRYDQIHTATVIFCSCEEIADKDLQLEISTFYQRNYQPDKIFAIGSRKASERLKEVFITNQNQTFKGIPKKQDTFLDENFYLLTYGKNGDIQCENEKQIPEKFLTHFRQQGLQQIFISRGGLIVSESSHHYVFPSGKHCDRFLRTGNILLYSPEIYFIAFCLLQSFNEELFTRIYCDTSSINSVAYALFDLKSTFLSKKMKVSIESFSSYDGLYQKNENITKDSFLLVSASTSSNILKYILEIHQLLERDNIIVLYFLGKKTDVFNIKDQVLCDLTKSPSNENGIDFYPTFLERDCELCKKGSYPVPVLGDVFLLEKPKVNKILLSVSDRDPKLSHFMNQFMAEKRKNCVFKSHFKERSQNKYEVYIDFSQIIKSMSTNPLMADFKIKLYDYISQYIPFDTKYLVYLDDDGSRDLAALMIRLISPHFKRANVPILIKQDDLTSVARNISGAIVVVGSCISNGKNLLYISRALRKHDQLKIVYFIGIARTSNKDYLKNLASNLSRGKYGAATNSFIAIETMFCSSNSRSTSWIAEIQFLMEIILFIKNSPRKYPKSLKFFLDRKKQLEYGSGAESRGLTNTLFYPNISSGKEISLSLRKNFAFFDFDGYVNNVTQADVYFTISNIINSLRNSENTKRQLKQAVYVRTLIDPHNFNRFNDGVIQASILRSASPDELSFSIDTELSLEMFNTLDTIIQYHTQEQGEALLEFLYAIATKKLSLTTLHLSELLQKIITHCKLEIFICMEDFIRDKLITKPEKLRSEPFKK